MVVDHVERVQAPRRTHRKIAPAELVANRGGRYAGALGIDLAAPDPGERFKWFLAALLYGTRISESVATRTWREFETHGVQSPQRIAQTGQEMKKNRGIKPAAEGDKVAPDRWQGLQGGEEMLPERLWHGC